MPENMRVRNATEMLYDGIQFRSKLEVMTYKTLLEAGIVPEYEKHTYTIWKGFTPTVPLFTKNTLKRKDCRFEVLSPSTMIAHRPLKDIVYTPDFYFEYGDKKIMVEVKGFSTETYLHRIKMFRKYLEEQPDRDSYMIWEIHTKKQLLECINYLKTSLSR